MTEPSLNMRRFGLTWLVCSPTGMCSPITGDLPLHLKSLSLERSAPLLHQQLPTTTYSTRRPPEYISDHRQTPVVLELAWALPICTRNWLLLIFRGISDLICRFQYYLKGFLHSYWVFQIWFVALSIVRLCFSTVLALFGSVEALLGVFWSLVMAEDKVISILLKGDNYSHWACVMKNFIVGKGMRGHVTGSIKNALWS